jgi:hypothetical protein
MLKLVVMIKKAKKKYENIEMKDENEDFEENEILKITITTCNKMGRKATINRCLLFPLTPEPLRCDNFLVLECHFGRSKAPFCYDTSMNKYINF